MLLLPLVPLPLLSCLPWIHRDPWAQQRACCTRAWQGRVRRSHAHAPLRPSSTNSARAPPARLPLRPTPHARPQHEGPVAEACRRSLHACACMDARRQHERRDHHPCVQHQQHRKRMWTSYYARDQPLCVFAVRTRSTEIWDNAGAAPCQDAHPQLGLLVLRQRREPRRQRRSAVSVRAPTSTRTDSTPLPVYNHPRTQPTPHRLLRRRATPPARRPPRAVAPPGRHGGRAAAADAPGQRLHRALLTGSTLHAVDAGAAETGPTSRPL